MILTTEQAEALARLQEQHENDWQRVAEVLFRDNYKARDKARGAREQAEAATSQIEELESRIEQLQAKAAEKPQGVVLPEADAALLEAYRALGAPDELTQQLAEAKQAAAKQRNSDVASIYQWRPEVLADLLKRDGVEPIIKELPTADGSKKRAAVVTVDGQETALDQYAAERWSLYAPALAAAEAAAANGNGVAFPKQPTPERPKRPVEQQTEIVKNVLSKRYKPAGEK